MPEIYYLIDDFKAFVEKAKAEGKREAFERYYLMPNKSLLTLLLNQKFLRKKDIFLVLDETDLEFYRRLIKKLESLGYPERAESTVNRAETLLGRVIPKNIILLFTLGGEEGITIYENGVPNIYVGLDYLQDNEIYPKSDLGFWVKSQSRLKDKARGNFVTQPYMTNTVRSKIDDNAVFQDESAILNSAKAEFGIYFDLVLAHELGHAGRDTIPGVMEVYGGSIKMGHSELLSVTPFEEHVVGEGMATYFSEAIYPNNSPMDYLFYEPWEYKWCQSHESVIWNNFQKARGTRGNLSRFYQAGSLGQGSPGRTDYYLGYRAVKEALTKYAFNEVLGMEASKVISFFKPRPG